jgi:acetyltransferase EpsM
MSDVTPVLIPLLNPNEPEALLAALNIHEGQLIASGDLLCTLETTKAAVDLLAEGSGYIAGLNFQQGQSAHAGDLLCYLAPTLDWQPAAVPASISLPAPSRNQPVDLRITRPALALARQHNLDLGNLPHGKLITEKHIHTLIALGAKPKIELPQGPYDPNAIVVYGGGGHGKALIDMLRLLGTYPIVGVLDDHLPPGELILDVPVLGGAETLPRLLERGVHLAVNAVGGIGNIAVRIKVFEQLTQAGFICPALVHPSAVVEPSAHLSDGVQIFPHAYVGSSAQINFGAIINTGAIVSHDCLIGDYANLSPGAILAGEVRIGAGVLVGMGVTINLQVKVGRGARLGNSATIKEDVPEGGIVRAGMIWPVT